MTRWGVRLSLLWFVSLSLVAPATASQLPPQTPGTVSYVNFDILVAIYTGPTPYGQFTPTQVQSVYADMADVRNFYWRNSRGVVNLTVSFLEIDKARTASDYDGGFLGQASVVAQDLRDRGVTNDQYDVVVGVALGNGNYGLGLILGLGSTLYSTAFGAFPLLHELHHSLEYAANSSGFEYLDVHPDFVGIYGPDYDVNAYIFRTWPRRHWFELREPWGTTVTVEDTDEDGLADDDPQAVLDERRFGTSPTLPDTDGDELSDLDEATASQDRAADPVNVDSDSDGILDGGDPYPTYAVRTRIPRYSPIVDGTIESPWPLFYHNASQNMTSYLAWDATGLHLAIRMASPQRFTIWLDANHDGWLRGPTDDPDDPAYNTIADNYELVVDPVQQRVISAHARYPETAIWAGSPGWEEALIQPSQIALAVNAGGTEVELTIPVNEATYLTPEAGDMIGVTLNSAGQWHFDRQHLIEVTLVDTVPMDVASPVVPLLLSPPDGSVSPAREMSFEWSPVLDVGSAGLEGYQVQVDDQVTFESPLAEGIVLTPQYSVRLPAFSSRYYWRVRGRDRAGNTSPFTATRVFESNDSFMEDPPTPITGNSRAQWYPAIDGDRIVWPDGGTFQLYLYDLVSRTTRQLTTGAAVLFSSFRAISGDRIVWQDYRSGNPDIYLYDLITGIEQRITNHPRAQEHPAISGNRLVWQDERNGNADIYLYDLATGTEQQITADSARQIFPAISGNRLVWEDFRNGNSDIYLYDLSTSSEQQITSHAANPVNPAIDGDRLVWQDLRNGNWDVYLYDLTTQTERRITSHSADQINPAISSHRLVWQDTRNGNWDIYLYDLRQLPVLDPISDWTIPEGQWLTFAVSASDPGGDPLTLSATGLPWGADFPVATGAGNVSGTFHWTPTFEQSGTYQVTFLVSAGNTEVVKTATLTVENVNGAPTLDPLGDQTVREGTLLQVTVGASDPEGDVLTYSASPLPSGASFDVTGGILSWTPDATQAGPYPVTVMATDPRGLRDSTMITITVLDNPPPSLRLLDPDVDDNGVVTILDVLAVAGAFGSHEPRYDLTGDGIVNIFDILLAAGAFGLRWAPTSLPEGQLLRFYVTATDPQGDPLTYSATALPAGASFNPTTREFLWRPGYAQAGSYTVSFTASDGSQSDTQNLPITVTNLGLAIASLTDSPDPFSPSLGQTTTIAATFNQPVTSWTLEIRGPQPATTLQRSFAYSGAATTTLSQLWDGRTSAGLLVPTGTYPYTLTATAAAGSNGGSATRGGTVTVQ